MDVTSYLLGKKSGGGTPINNQDKDVTITANGTSTVTADTGYTGLGEVEITTNVQPDLESKSVTITENTTTTITPTQGKDGLSQVSVTTDLPPADIGEYFNDIYDSDWRRIVKKLPSPFVITTRYPMYFFSEYSGEIMPITSLEYQDIRSLSYVFYNCNIVKNIDISNWKVDNTLKDMSNMFSSCERLQIVNLGNNIDTSNVTTMEYLFFNCHSLQKIIGLNNFNTSNVTNMGNMFNTAIVSMTEFDISNFDMGKVNNIESFLLNPYGTKGLTTLKFGYDLGKGYSTTAPANFEPYTLNLSQQTKLSHDSLMSVINGLYDIANAGVQPQQLILGSTNLAKLTQAEIDIAVNKGWNVS